MQDAMLPMLTKREYDRQQQDEKESQPTICSREHAANKMRCNTKPKGQPRSIDATRGTPAEPLTSRLALKPGGND
jgi:hypothetical protein